MGFEQIITLGKFIIFKHFYYYCKLTASQVIKSEVDKFMNL